jgi:tetratricopeptide (TPR) repeat protein
MMGLDSKGSKAVATESPSRYAGGDLLSRYPEYTYTRLKAALETLERANGGEGAERSEFLRTKAELYEHLFEYDQALICIDKAIEAEPLSVAHLMAKGALLRKVGNLKAALQTYKRVLEVEPDHASARNFFSELYDAVVRDKREKDQMALSELEEIQRAVFEFEKKAKWTEALSTLDREMSKRPHLGELALIKGEILEQAGRQADAIGLYDDIISAERERLQLVRDAMRLRKRILRENAEELEGYLGEHMNDPNHASSALKSGLKHERRYYNLKAVLTLRDRSSYAPALFEQVQKRSLYFDDTVINALADLARDDDVVLTKARQLGKHRDDLVRIRAFEVLLGSERAEGNREETLAALEKIHYAALKKNDTLLDERAMRALRRFGENIERGAVTQFSLYNFAFKAEEQLGVRAVTLKLGRRSDDIAGVYQDFGARRGLELINHEGVELGIYVGEASFLTSGGSFSEELVNMIDKTNIATIHFRGGDILYEDLVDELISNHQFNVHRRDVDLDSLNVTLNANRFMAALEAHDVKSHIKLGTQLRKEGKLREAMIVFKKSYELDPEEKSVWFYLAQTSKELGLAREYERWKGFVVGKA